MPIANVHYCTRKMPMILTLTEVAYIISPVYTTLDYEYRRNNKGTDQGLVLRKCGV